MALSPTGISGLLEKNARGRSVFSAFGGWKQRQFSLQEQILSYSDPADPSKPLGSISTAGCTVDPIVQRGKKKFVFVVHFVKNGTNAEAGDLELNAGDSKIRKRWADAIATSSNNASWRNAPVTSATNTYLAGNARAMGASPDRPTLIKIMEEKPQWESKLGWKKMYEENKVMSIWPGVVLDPKGSGLITRLILSDFGLEGTLPNAISELAGLEMIILNGNPGITGNIPESWANLVSLSKLFASTTGLVPKEEVPAAVKAIPGLKKGLQMPNPELAAKTTVPKFEKETVKGIPKGGTKKMDPKKKGWFY